MRWMVSATAAACALPGVERSRTRSPALLRLSEALKVAKRTCAGLAGLAALAEVRSAGPAAAGAVMAEAARAATAAARAVAAAAEVRRAVRVRMGNLPNRGSRQPTTGAWPVEARG